MKTKFFTDGGITYFEFECSCGLKKIYRFKGAGMFKCRCKKEFRIKRERENEKINRELA